MKKYSAPVIIFILSALLVGMQTACGPRAQSATNTNNGRPASVDVTVAGTEARDIPVYFEATGSLASDEQTDVAPLVGGKITEVNFDIGSYVTKGAVLVRLDDRDARLKIEQAEKQAQQSNDAVEQARANLRQAFAKMGLSENQNFNVTQIAEVKTAKATLDLAEQEYKRAERLVESGDIPRTTFDQRRTQRDQARSQYEAALNLANQNYAGIKIAQAGLQSSISAAKTAQVAVDQARKSLGDMSVLAPISGYVSDKVADPGEFVGTANKIATIMRTSILRLRIDVPEQAVGTIKPGQSVSLRTSAYPDRNFTGTIARVLPGLNTNSRTLTVEAEVDSAGGALKPGLFATVRIAQGQTEKVVMVPANAIRSDGGTSKVFVIKDGRAEEHIVQLGENENDLVQVKQGLAGGEQVATSNLEQVYDGVSVNQAQQ
jgi:multidrug efflux pump subunit AcrA (membrane-fusion protein)